MLNLRSGWDALAFPAIREGHPESTLNDWVAFVPPTGGSRETYRLSRYQNTYPADFRRLDHVTLPYTQYSDRMTINGGAFAVKRSLLLAVPLNTRLHWAEIEDGDWSERLTNHGAVISLAHEARVENVPPDTRVSASKGLLAAARAPYKAARLGARSAIFGAVSNVVQRLGRRNDLFRTRGVFSNEIAPFPANDVMRLPAVAWPAMPAVFVRGDLERRLDLRALLEQVRRYCPAQTGVYFELATSGVGFFTRATGVRNCEVLMYEISLVLGDDFELRSLFCSTELNFLIHLFRISKASPSVVGPLHVVADDAAWASRDDAMLNAFGVAWQRAPLNAALERQEGTVLLLRDARNMGSIEHWRAAYAVAGFVVQRQHADSRVLDGNMLCSVKHWLELCDGRALDLANWCDLQRAEVSAVLQGRWPAQIAADGSFR